MIIGRCNVCGKVGEVWSRSSLCGAMTTSYCRDCLKNGAEPWDDLVKYISLAGHYPKDINAYYQGIVKDTCKYLGKTEEEFAKAVDEEIKNESLRNYESV